MFSLIRLLIWLTGFVVLSYFVMGFFGYTINLAYFQASKNTCRKELLQCQKEIIKGGIEGAKENCHIECIDPKLIVKRSE